jgi:glycerol uptake facilitator-like aquaporin
MKASRKALMTLSGSPSTRAGLKMSLARRSVAEFVGTGFLVAAVLGSGIMGERLAAENVAIALLANTVATGAALIALILTFGPISGAHFNPVVTLVDVGRRDSLDRSATLCAH